MAPVDQLFGADRTSSVASAHRFCSARWSRNFFWMATAPAAVAAMMSSFLSMCGSSG